MAGRRTASFTVTVAKPPDEVFAYLADVTKHAEWSPKPFRIEDLSGPVGKGTTFTSYGWVPRDPNHRNDVEVIEYDPPRRFALQSTEKGENFINTFELSAEGSGTRVDRTLDMPTPGGALGIVFPIIVNALIKPGVQKGMVMFKNNLEQASA